MSGGGDARSAPPGVGVGGEAARCSEPWFPHPGVQVSGCWCLLSPGGRNDAPSWPLLGLWPLVGVMGLGWGLRASGGF